MNQVTVRKEQTKIGLLEFMADKYMLKPEQFRDTVRATCGLSTATAEQVAAFLIVAKTYNLNPILKEIYAYPSRAGGIVPIVSIDGWVNLVNSHPACDGFEFEMDHGDDNDLISCTCRMFRKDRSHPVTVTEYLSECQRPTDPWKMKHRMLRHKSLIQAARYAFGFAGVYDEDEARNIIENEPKNITPSRVPSPSEVEAKSDPIATEQKMPSTYGLPDIDTDYDGFIKTSLKLIADSSDGGALETFFNSEIASREAMLFPPDWSDLCDALGKKQAQLKEADQ